MNIQSFCICQTPIETNDFPIQPIKCELSDGVPMLPIIQSVPLVLPVLKVISFSPLDQQLLRSLPLDHVTEITCHLFKMVQSDFEEGKL